jgi:hypothetical protein
MQKSATTTADGVESSSQPKGAASSLRRFVLGTLAGIGIGLIIMLLVVRQANYDPTPNLTVKEFDAAYDRWKANAPPDYDIEIRVTGPQAAVYRASVRSGQPEAAWRNDRPLTQRRTFGTWSVPGMFSTISRDVAALEQAAAKGAQPPLILRAAFNAEHGYPERYRRIDNGSRKGGDASAVTWDVTSFEVVPPQTSVNGPLAPESAELP